MTKLEVYEALKKDGGFLTVEAVSRFIFADETIAACQAPMVRKMLWQLMADRWVVRENSTITIRYKAL